MGFEKRLGVSLETNQRSSSDADLNIYDFTVPNQTEWVVLSVWVQYITGDEGVASAVRQLRLRFMNTTAASDAFLDIAPGITQDSGLTYEYNFFPGAADLTSIRDTDQVMTPIPGGLVLGPGMNIQLEDVSSEDTDNDAWDIQIAVEKYRTLSAA